MVEIVRWAEFQAATWVTLRTLPVSFGTLAGFGVSVKNI